jgi:hypothetical protein
MFRQEDGYGKEIHWSPGEFDRTSSRIVGLKPNG